MQHKQEKVKKKLIKIIIPGTVLIKKSYITLMRDNGKKTSEEIMTSRSTRIDHNPIYLNSQFWGVWLLQIYFPERMPETMTHGSWNL